MEGAKCNRCRIGGKERSAQPRGWFLLAPTNKATSIVECVDR